MIRAPSPEHVVWLDGAFVPWPEATIHASDHHYGFGVFEGVRAYATDEGAAIFRLRDHTARLLRSAHILNLELPTTYDLDAAQRELLKRNRLRDAYLRPFVFCSGVSGLSPKMEGIGVHVAIFAIEWPGADAEATARGIALRTASFVRHHTNSLLSKAKANGNYMNSILGVREARACGADDALFLDHDGFVTEASGANVFVVRGGAIYTPPLASVLEGITRDTIVALAAARGIAVAERRMTRDDVYVADEVFLTGTAAEVTPVREVDGRKIGRGARGPITERLQSTYAALVRGRGETHRDWLTAI